MKAFLLTLTTPDTDPTNFGVVMAESFEAALPKLEEVARKDFTDNPYVDKEEYSLRSFQTIRLNHNDKYLGRFPIVQVDESDDYEFVEEMYHVEEVLIYTI